MVSEIDLFEELEGIRIHIGGLNAKLNRVGDLLERIVLQIEKTNRKEKEENEKCSSSS